MGLFVILSVFIFISIFHQYYFYSDLSQTFKEVLSNCSFIVLKGFGRGASRAEEEVARLVRWFPMI